jgi:AraC-like DNA-binding protein
MTNCWFEKQVIWYQHSGDFSSNCFLKYEPKNDNKSMTKNKGTAYSSMQPDLALASGDYLSVVRAFALSKGISPSALLEGSNLSLNEFINPPELISNLLINRIGINLYDSFENPLAEAVHYGLNVTSASHGSLGMAVQCSRDLREGLAVLAKFYNTRLASQDAQINYDSKLAHIRLVSNIRLSQHPQDVQRFFDLSTIVSMAQNVKQALPEVNDEQKIYINIDHPEPEQFPFSEMPYCEFSFDAEILEMGLPLEWLDLPFKSANKEIAAAAIARCEAELRRIKPQDLVEKIRVNLSNIDGSVPSIDEIAELHCMSVSTLKRRLNEQSTSYIQLKNEARLALAQKLLSETPSSIEDIAEILAFSDASNFTKFFKKEQGMTPKRYRNTVKE